MAGGDFGEDIVKSLLKGCLVVMAIMVAVGALIYYSIQYLFF